MALLGDDEYISARTVLSDATRLAFDGYKLVDTDTENTIGLTVQLMDGQRQHLLLKNVFQAVRNRPGEIARERARPLLQAFAHFLNAGGSPGDLVDYAHTFAQAPQIEYRDFELAGVYEEVEREVYYIITKDQRVIRVCPGIMSEEVSKEELEDDEEDSEEGAGAYSQEVS